MAAPESESDDDPEGRPLRGSEREQEVGVAGGEVTQQSWWTLNKSFKVIKRCFYVGYLGSYGAFYDVMLTCLATCLRIVKDWQDIVITSYLSQNHPNHQIRCKSVLDSVRCAAQRHTDGAVMIGLGSFH